MAMGNRHGQTDTDNQRSQSWQDPMPERARLVIRCVGTQRREGKDGNRQDAESDGDNPTNIKAR